MRKKKHSMYYREKNDTANHNETEKWDMVAVLMKTDFG